MSKPVVLYACVHNAGRSLAAKVLTEHHAQGAVDVRSAGSEPGESLNLVVVQVLHELGLSTDGETPKLLTYARVQQADVVVTMGCRRDLPRAPRQDLRGLGPGRPEGPEPRHGPPDRRGGRRPGAGPARAAPRTRGASAAKPRYRLSPVRGGGGRRGGTAARPGRRARHRARSSSRRCRCCRPGVFAVEAVHLQEPDEQGEDEQQAARRGAGGHGVPRGLSVLQESVRPG